MNLDLREQIGNEVKRLEGREELWNGLSQDSVNELQSEIADKLKLTSRLNNEPDSVETKEELQVRYSINCKCIVPDV